MKSPIVARINSLLAEQDIKKQTFFEDCGITSASFSQWNTGKTVPRMKNLEVIAKYLRTSTNFLLTGINTDFKVTFPAKEKVNAFIPDDADIQKVLDHCKSSELTELWIAIMLARYYGLRRGEICALDSGDLKDDILWITKDCILTYDKQWIIKPIPKTAESYRFLTLSEPLLSVLKGIDGKYITCHPDALDNRFYRALKTCKIQKFGLHRLRHSFASHSAIMGIPDIYTAKMGGWSPNSPILKTVYQNVIDKEFEKQMKRINKAIPK